MERLRELVRLHRMSTGFREVARLLEMSPNTERHSRLALMLAGLLAGEVSELPELVLLKQPVKSVIPSKAAPQQVSSIEKWLESITSLSG